jgi:hypothetical protein
MLSLSMRVAVTAGSLWLAGWVAWLTRERSDRFLFVALTQAMPVRIREDHDGAPGVHRPMSS